jgi:hypothetical protein
MSITDLDEALASPGEATREFYREQGRKEELQRILGLLEDYDFSAIWRQVAWSPDAWESFGSDDLIALIKGEK